MSSFLTKIKTNKSLMYLLCISILLLLCISLNITFAVFSNGFKGGGANISINNLKYRMIINEVELNESVGTSIPSNTIIGDRIILLKAGKTEQFNTNLISLNNIATKYEIVYKVCSDVNCTSFIDTPDDIEIAYHIDTPYVNGELKANKSKTITLVSDNSTNKDYYVQIGLNAGYSHNTLALTNQITNDFSPASLDGILSIVAYVNGEEVETFPTEPNYNTGIVCWNKKGTEIQKDAAFSYSAKNGWEVNIYGLNKSLTKCEVNFTSSQRVTYEVLKKSYSCANLDDAEKSSKPIISYSGNCTLIQDTENSDGTHTWRMKLLNSGTLTASTLIYIDAFLVGGGGGGGGGRIHNGLYYSGAGGGGGYTKTLNDVKLDNITATYSIVIGSGGTAGGYSSTGGSGGATTAFGGTAAGGAGGSGGANSGGDGGSGGGRGNHDKACDTGAKYGNDGSGKGQGTTTCEFGEGTLSGCTRGDDFAYSTAGCNAPAKVNSGNGGQGGSTSGSDGYTGYSGIVVIRDVRT